MRATIVLLLLATTAAADDAAQVKLSRVSSQDQTSLTAKQVSAKIASSYIGGMRRCYELLLAKTPDAGGAATVKITVGPVGKLAKPAASSFDGTLTRCLKARVASWRFPIPLKYAEPTSARFTIVLEMKPPPPPPPPPPDLAP
jgi:hypothetical protein